MSSEFEPFAPAASGVPLIPPFPVRCGRDMQPVARLSSWCEEMPLGDCKLASFGSRLENQSSRLADAASNAKLPNAIPNFRHQSLGQKSQHLLVRRRLYGDVLEKTRLMR
jgi:hypothetical protein